MSNRGQTDDKVWSFNLACYETLSRSILVGSYQHDKRELILLNEIFMR